MKRATCYIRVSKAEQSTENQLPAIKSFCILNGMELVEVYAENESAWAQGHQHELKHLLNDLRSGYRKYDYCIVWAADRLTRGGIVPMIQLLNTFERLHCPIISLKEPLLSTDGPTRDLFAALIGWFANFESTRKSERTREGLKKALAKGKKLGRPLGKKDGKKRTRAGYYNRWTKKGKQSPGEMGGGF